MDPSTQRIVWLRGPGNLTVQHHPRLLDNGVEASRVIEVDPLSWKIVWSYAVDGFFSEKRGSVQRLPNGNMLITESDPGYAMEVDIEGRVVWEFANPDVDDEGKTLSCLAHDALHAERTPVSFCEITGICWATLSPRPASG